MKSSLVVAGLGDLMRPAEKLSLNQSISLAATGLIWTRVRHPLLRCPFTWIGFDLVLHGDHSKELLSRTGQSRSGLDRSSTDHPHRPSSFNPSSCTTTELADPLSRIHSIGASNVPIVFCSSLVFLSFANLIMQSMYLSFFYDFSNSSSDFISDVDDRPNASAETDQNRPMGICSTPSCHSPA